MINLEIRSEPVQDSWIDLNGHLNEDYYLVACSQGAFEWLAQFGATMDYFYETGRTIYTVETHLRYLDEVHLPAVLDIEFMILGSDAKRVHGAHVVRVDGKERATVECIYLHVDAKAGRAVAMPDAMQAAFKSAELSELPDWSGSQVTLARR